VRPGDAAGIRDLVLGLSPLARSMRFGHVRRGLSAAEAAAMASAPGDAGRGLVAVAGGEHERLVALARYERAPGAEEAEFALMVADAWQGSGLGTGLLERLLALAREDGLRALRGFIRPDNWPMREVLARLGCDLEQAVSTDEVVVRLPVGIDERLEEASIARRAAAAAASLVPLMAPRSIAVVGASHDPTAPGGAVLAAIRASGFPGRIVAVNRRGGDVAGLPAVPSLAIVPGPVDLVVVAVPALEVPGVARQAAAIGARAMVVLSSGFAEEGPGGAALQAELLHVVRVSGIRLVGPNCLGVMSSSPGAAFDATFAPQAPSAGPVGIASQSGGVGVALMDGLSRRGVGVSAFVSLGNRADVSSNDLLAWWGADPRTRVVLLHLESFGNPRRFARMARHVAATTPVLALKAGRGPSGRRGAGSHTAALAAGEAPTDALFALAGVVRVDGLEDLLDTGQVLAGQPLPAGDRVAILANAGGAGVIAADVCEAHDVRVPELSASLREALAELAPGAAGLSNPVDLGAAATPERMAAVGAALAASGEVDAILAIVAHLRGGDPAALRASVEGLCDGRVTVVGCALGAEPAPTPGAGGRVLWHAFPEGAARALAHAVRAGEAARRPPDPAARPPGIDRGAARAVLERARPGEWLGAADVEALLAAYGIRMPASAIARSSHEAAAAQRSLGRPVAVKAADPVVPHKTELGAVVTGCGTPAAAARAYRDIADALARAEGVGPLRGALVQEMAPDCPEVIVGAVADPVFGPVVLCGIGGVEAELWGDRAVALAPAGPRTAADLIGGLRGARLLDGWRGAPACDREVLADLVSRVGWLAAEQPLLAELDCNPVRAPLGGEALVVDARVRRA
jgi:acyl-CoA synthetase (NDP forming)/GNAT superfamily N-acetyltransferase